MIPNAEEFLFQEEYYQCSSGDSDEIKNVMIDFAKLHVQAALKEAYNVAELEAQKMFACGADYIPADKELILNSYPLNLIK